MTIPEKTLWGAAALALACSFLPGCARPPSLEPDAVVSAEAAFAELKSMVGSWRKRGTAGTDFRIDFSLTAGGTVLVESWRFGDRVHSLTLYHRDLDGLLATHYCPQGNQPRLRMAGRDHDGTIRFEFQDASNLASLADSHQLALSFQVAESGQFTIRRESYIDRDGEHWSQLELERMGPAD